MNWLDIFIRLLQPGVTAFGVWVAWQGLKTWQRQLYGQSGFDLARRLMLAVYKVRSLFVVCRILLSKENGQELITKLFEQLAEVDACSDEAQAIWGIDTEKAMNKLRACVGQYRLNVGRYYAKERQTSPLNAEENSKLDEVIWGDLNDEFGKKITEAVAEFYRLVQDHLPRRPN